MNYKRCTCENQVEAKRVTIRTNGVEIQYIFYGLETNQIKAILRGWRALHDSGAIQVSIELYLKANGVTFKAITPEYDLFVEL